MVADRLMLAGAVVSAVWIALAVLVFWLTEAGSGRGILPALVAVILPLGLIWLAVLTARALAGLRDEAHSLRAQLLTIRQALPQTDERSVDDVPPLPGHVPPPLPPSQMPSRPPATLPPRAATGGGARPAAATALRSREPAKPAVAEVSADDLIAALNFPDGPDDRPAIEALRRALADGETARLIRSAQDVVTLLAGQGLYMDDLAAPAAPAAVWRRFAEGTRGPALAEAAILAGGGDDSVALADLLRGDEVFRDTAQHFLRRWDRMLTREVPGMSDALVERLIATRSGRAFVTVAQATGMFG